MKIDPSKTTDRNITFFYFEMTKSYEIIDLEYQQHIKPSHNPELLSQFIIKYPYHTEALLSLSYLLECQNYYKRAIY